MEFGPVPVAQAEGAILAHSVAVPGGRLRKGIVLTAADLDALSAQGLSAVTVARLAGSDVHEDDAAARLGAAVVEGSGLVADAAVTGRVNLRAPGPGIVEVDAATVGAVNTVDEMLTLATVAPFARLDARGLAATIKVISYGVDAAAVARACAAARGALRFHPVQRRQAVLIQTVVPGEDGARGHEALTLRLERLGAQLAPKVVVPHETGALRDALRDVIGATPQQGAVTKTDGVIFVLTGSATSDPYDVGPAALRAAGGRVERFGMPVDPGNLLFLGDLDGVPVIGLPGCARSAALNGADWVLERVLCGVPVSAQDIAGMGVGGLLKEIPSRPRPREG
ncbi:MAG: molybdopterin biosynthesis protein [Rhodobacterales bacterium]|nr:MAG: molybdopterin biosynthesis protein [Rhodobacterales bacterium]